MPKSTTSARDFLTDAKTMIAIVSAIIGVTIFTYAASDTAIDAEDKADNNTSEITKMKDSMAVIPYIQKDVEQLKVDVKDINQEITQIKNSQFRSEVTSKQQLELLKRALEHLPNDS